MGIYIVLVAAVVPLLALFLLWKYTYWYRQGVPQGSLLEMLSGEVDVMMPGVSYWDLYLTLGRKYSKRPFYGVYSFMNPFLVVRDTEMVKDIFLRKFSSFSRNGFEVDEQFNPILSRDPFLAPIERWKESRSQFTSLMTPGRLRLMFTDMIEVGKEAVKYVKDLKHESGKGDGTDVKDLTVRYLTSVLMRQTLSVNAECFNDQKSAFLEKARGLFNISGGSYLFWFFLIVAPKLGAKLGYSFPSKEIIAFFTDVIESQKEYRAKSGTPRNDVLDQMLKRASESKKTQNDANAKGSKKEEDEVNLDILSMIMMFIMDGFEAMCTLSATCAVELARDPELQENVRQQILTDCPLGTDITEEACSNATLLQNCLLESMRVYPPNLYLQRKATENVTLNAKTGEKINLKKGAFLFIPLVGNMRDPENFPEPDKFDPNRFEDEAQKRLFLVFGDGPRQCPGQRFSMLAAKVLLAMLLREFRLELSPKTKMPLETVNHSIFFSPKCAWIRFVPL